MKEALRGGDAVDDATNDKKRKRSKGRQKIEIKPIEREAQRQVSFSKRRSGLFKKAYELSILCGAHVAVIAFSPGNKPFSFIHPSAPSVLDRYLASQSSQPQQNRLLNDAPTSDATVSNLSSQLAELTTMLEAAKRRKDALKERVRTLDGNLCIDGDVSRLGWSELNNLQMQLERVKADILARADELFMNGAQFMDVTGIHSNAFYGYGLPGNDGVMPLLASSGFVSEYLVPSMTAYPPVDYGFSYDGQIFI